MSDYSGPAFEYKDMGLDNLLRALTGDLPQARVGVLGSNNSRTAGKSNNATIGKNHEFGEIVKLNGRDVKLPERSFLRVPIAENMQGYLDSSGMFTKEAERQVVRDGSLVPWITNLGIIGVSIVLDAFKTGGFGKWKPSNMKFKKNHQTLVETQQLRNSITWDVKE